MGKMPYTLLLTVTLILDSVSKQTRPLRTFAASATLFGSHPQVHVGREIRTEKPNITSPRHSLHAGYFFIFCLHFPINLILLPGQSPLVLTVAFSIYPAFWYIMGLFQQFRRCTFDPRSFLGWEGPLEKEMAACSRILAWRIPWTEEPDGPLSGRSEWGTAEWVTLSRLSEPGSSCSWPLR